MKKLLNGRAWLAAVLVIAFTFACSKKEPEVIAGYSFASDVVDFRKVTFKNTSQNFSKLSWNFGDNTPVSAEIDPVHVYAGAGEFTVVLTATSNDGKSTDISSQKVVVADANAQLTALSGSLSKVWKLHRGVSPTNNSYPLQVGPFARNEVWWSVGGVEALYKRACMLNDEYTFTRADGTMKYDAKGDTWGEGGTFKNKDKCIATTAAEMIGENGEDLTKWGNGTHKFRIQGGSKPTLTVIGKGAFIGLQKVGTNLEYKTPQDSVTYNIIKLTDAAVDTMILEVEYKFNAADATPGGYWRFVLVHYDNPAAEPAIPDPSPEASFTTVVNGLTATFTNTSKFGTTYLWDFGDGTTATTKDVTKVYTASSLYKIKMTATNPAGSASSTQESFVTTSILTDAALQGAAWKVRADDNSVVVGPGLGNNSWYTVPKNALTGVSTGVSTGVDDWSCLANDEFTFSTGGVYKYDTKGNARNDGYMGGANGCISDAELAASGNGSAFKTATHSYVFTAAAGANRAKIVVSNGATGSAFIGFYKAYFGGENGDKAKPVNGGATSVTYQVMGYAKSATKEYMYITCDISTGKDGSAAWSFVLQR